MAASADTEALRSNVLSIRGTKEWREWVYRFCTFSRTKSAADLIDQALVELAKVKGFTEPPPER